ncbi:MAG: hypothetical protein HY073_05805 [Deltaproteobacteria bacterium]|nr:hypothetical protein [Deltaproteobacteria bacterium]
MGNFTDVLRRIDRLDGREDRAYEDTDFKNTRGAVCQNVDLFAGSLHVETSMQAENGQILPFDCSRLFNKLKFFADIGEKNPTFYMMGQLKKHDREIIQKPTEEEMYAYMMIDTLIILYLNNTNEGRFSGNESIREALVLGGARTFEGYRSVIAEARRQNLIQGGKRIRIKKAQQGLALLQRLSKKYGIHTDILR